MFDEITDKISWFSLRLTENYTYDEQDGFEYSDETLKNAIWNLGEEQRSAFADKRVESGEERRQQTADNAEQQRWNQCRQVHLDVFYHLTTIHSIIVSISNRQLVLSRTYCEPDQPIRKKSSCKNRNYRRYRRRRLKVEILSVMLKSLSFGFILYEKQHRRRPYSAS